MNFLFRFLTEATVPEAPTASPVTSATEMMPSYEGTFLKMFLTLLALIVGIFVTVWLLKRMAQGRWSHGNGNRSIKITERRALSPKTMLYIVDVDGKEVVIAESQLEVKRLMTLDEPIDDRSSDSK